MSREYPKRPFVGVGALVFSTKGVLLIKRAKPPRMNEWSIPGGLQETGETVFDAAQREVKEECGINVTVHGLVDVIDSITHDDDARVQYHYTLIDVLATTTETALTAGSDAAAAAWHDVAAIEELNLWSETNRAIRKAHGMWQQLAPKK